MIASKVVGEFALPYVIGTIGRIAGASIEEGMITRNPHQSGEFTRNSRTTVNLQPTGGYSYDDPRRQSNIDTMMELRDRNMRIREETKNAPSPIQPTIQPTIQEQYQGYGMSPFSQQPNEIIAQPVIQSIDTQPVNDSINPPIPQIDINQSAFDDQDEIDIDEMHQHLIDNVMNGNIDDLPLDNTSQEDSIEYQRRQPDRPPEYPGNGGNYPTGPQIGDVVDKAGKIGQVISVLAPKQKKQDKPKAVVDKPKMDGVEPIDQKKTKMTGAKVDIHDIFAKTLVNRLPVNTKRLL